MKILATLFFIFVSFNFIQAQDIDPEDIDLNVPIMPKRFVSFENFNTVAFGVGFNDKVEYPNQTVYNVEITTYFIGLDFFLLGGTAVINYHDLDDKKDLFSETIAPIFGVKYGNINTLHFIFYSHIGPAIFGNRDIGEIDTHQGFHFCFGYNQFMLDFSINNIDDLQYINLSIKYNLDR
jgi:hypothetical protein